MVTAGKKQALLGASAVVWVYGSLIFGLLGILSPIWLKMFQITKASVGLLMTISLFSMGAFNYKAGRLADERGSRFTISIGMVLAAAALVGFSAAVSVYMLYGCGIILGISGSLVYGPGLTCVQKWWPKKSGMASGIYNLCFGLSSALMIPLYQLLLGGSGYQGALWWISGIVLVFGLGAAVFADSPKKAGGAGEGVKLPGHTVGQAVATRSFKLLWLIWGLAGTAGIGLVMHIIPLMEANGISADQGSRLLIFFNIFNGVIRIVVGPMLDKADGRLVMCTSFLLGGAACCILTMIRSFAPAALCLCLIGMTTGVVFTVTPVMLRKYFGLRNFGAVFGLIFTSYCFFSAFFGPFLGGFASDISGSYTVTTMYFGIFLIIAAGLSMALKRPEAGGGLNNV